MPLFPLGSSRILYMTCSPLPGASSPSQRSGTVSYGAGVFSPRMLLQRPFTIPCFLPVWRLSEICRICFFMWGTLLFNFSQPKCWRSVMLVRWRSLTFPRGHGVFPLNKCWSQNCRPASSFRQVSMGRPTSCATCHRSCWASSRLQEHP